MPDEDVMNFNDTYIKGELQVMFAELDIPINNDDIKSAIKQLHSGKSSGSDKLINEFYIHGSDTLTPYLCKLFNIVFNNAYFPSAWSCGDIIPLHKKRKYIECR